MTAPTGSWVMDQGIWRGLHGAEDIVPVIGGGGGGGSVTTPPSYVGGGDGRVGLDSVSCPWPSGHDVGDTGLLVVETNAQTITTPSGWTIFPGAPWTVGTAGAAGSVGLYLFWKRATSSSEANVTVPDSGDHNIARILAFRGGPDTGAPIDTVNIGSATVATASSSASFPDFSTAVANTRVVGVVAYGSDSAQDNAAGSPFNPSLAGIAIHTDTNGAAGNGGGFIVWSGTKAAIGAVGTTAEALVRSVKQVLVQFALLPGPPTTPPPTGSGRTMYGSEGFDDNPSLIGTAVTPDTLISNTSASSWITATTGWIDRLTAAGACAIMKVHPPNNSKNNDGTWKLRDDSTLDFSETKWNAIWDSFWAALGTSGQAKLRTAVAAGVIRALYVLDDFVTGAAPSGGVPSGNQFTHAVSYTQIETICQHYKADAPWLPSFARGNLDGCRSLALSNGTVRQYLWLDGAECAYRPKTDHRTGATARIAALIQAGQDCSLAAFGWNNILNWGTGDSTLNGGFGCIAGDIPSQCGESPSEILSALRALINRSEVHGIMLWAYSFGPSFWGRSDIQGALTTIAGELTGRVEGPNNIRTGANKHLDPA